MPVYDGINGVVRKRKEWPVGINGVVRQQKEHWAGIDGVKRRIFGASEKLASSYPIGSIVFLLSSSGKKIQYRVVQHGVPGAGNYDFSCNGTWLFRETVNKQHNFGRNNRFAGSLLFTFLNTELYESFSDSTKAAIRSVKIPHMNVAGSQTVSNKENGLSCKIFLLSAAEIGLTPSDSDEDNTYTIDGGKLGYFLSGDSITAWRKRQFAQFGETGLSYWLRSQSKEGNKSNVVSILTAGSSYAQRANYINGCVREALIINDTTKFDSETNTII